MTTLANNLLRATNLGLMLKDMGITLPRTPITANDEFFIFKPASLESAEKFCDDVQKLLQEGSEQIVSTKHIELIDLIIKEIDSATSNDGLTETHINSCKAILNVIRATGINYQLDEESETIEIQLPSPVYASLFKSLNYKHISLQGDKLIFNVRNYLHDKPQDLTIMTVDKQQNPLLFLKAATVEKKKVFYACKPLNDKIEITPYFFVPKAITPPVYRFILDTSTSMSDKMAVFIETVIAFAKMLYELHPEAQLHFQEFNSVITKLGSFKKENLPALITMLRKLKTRGETCLYRVSNENIAELKRSTTIHNHVLLCTDGLNDCLTNDEDKLLENIKQLRDMPLLTARNKFNVVSFNQEQPLIMHQLAKAFGSFVLDTTTPDFITALSTETLKEWAAARDLFIEKIEVQGGVTTSVHHLNLSGQFTRLATHPGKPGEEFKLTISDSQGDILFQDTQQLPVTPERTASATNVQAFHGNSIFSQISASKTTSAPGTSGSFTY